MKKGEWEGQQDLGLSTRKGKQAPIPITLKRGIPTIKSKSVRNKSNFGPVYLIKYGKSGILNHPERARYREKREMRE